MATDELIENIKLRFSQNEKAAEIKDTLKEEGWSEYDINNAFAQIRHEGLLVIPLYAKAYDWFQNVEQHMTQLSVRMQIQLLLGLLFVMAGGLYLVYQFIDPFNVRGPARDDQREKMFVSVRLSLDKYHQDTGTYPPSLAVLVPKYLQSEPLDPKTHDPLQYTAETNNTAYSLCMDFETRQKVCISNNNDTQSIPGVHF